MRKYFGVALVLGCLSASVAMAQMLPGQTVANPSKVENKQVQKPAPVVAPLPNNAAPLPNAAPSGNSADLPGMMTSNVSKNFSLDAPNQKYDNSQRKIISFKIVNGEMLIDKNAKRSVLVYYDNYKVSQGLDGMTRCSIRIYVLNDLEEKITNLGFQLKWPKLTTMIQMNLLNPGVRTYKDITLLGEGCFSMNKTPLIEINRCRVKNMSQEECADAVRWFENTTR